MSTLATNPTAVTEILATGESASIGIIGGADGPTAIFVSGGDASGFAGIKEMMDAFDPAMLLPDLTQIGDTVAAVARLAIMIGPLVLLAMGLAYLFLSPKEANYRFGYRCFFGMGSVQAWRYTQRMAGLIWGGLGIALTVIMGIISLGYSGNGVMDILDSALTCLIWEVVLVAASCVAINVMVLLRYDAKGALRKKEN